MRNLILGVTLLFISKTLVAQQVPDLKYQPAVASPAYKPGDGPHVAIDQSHHNFHTATGRYQPFADLLRRDGYQVSGFDKPFSAESLKLVNVLVIANPLNERNKSDWSLPTPCAFSSDEITAVHGWVEGGGSLFLIVDHMPFPGATGDLAKAFGIEFSNGYAKDGQWKQGAPDQFTLGTGLHECAITRGRSKQEHITKVVTFTGSAFKLPKNATPVLTFGSGSISHETRKAPGITPDSPQVSIEGWSQGALLTIGKGRVAVFGEAAMFSAQRYGANQSKTMGMNNPDATQNYQFLLNILHWLTRAKGMPD